MMTRPTQNEESLGWEFLGKKVEIKIFINVK